MIQVRNVGTDPRTYRSGSMIDGWRSKNHLIGGVKCCVRDCHAWAADGAHVIIEGRGQKRYIVPMCHKHNMQRGELLWVRDEALPVRLTSIK